MSLFAQGPEPAMLGGDQNAKICLWKYMTSTFWTFSVHTPTIKHWTPGSGETPVHYIFTSRCRTLRESGWWQKYRVRSFSRPEKLPLKNHRTLAEFFIRTRRKKPYFLQVVVKF
jgi:hypothetical protein